MFNEFRIPLLNAYHGDGELNFGFGFHVRDATTSEAERWNSDPLVHDVVPHRVLPEIRSVLVHRGASSYGTGDQAAEFEMDLMRWFALVSLFTGREVEAAFGEHWGRAGTDDEFSAASDHFLGPVRYLNLSLPVSEAPPWNRPIDIRDASAFFQNGRPRFASSSELSCTMHFVLSRWYVSLNKRRRTLEDAILDLSIALEALFVRDEERSNIAKLIRERFSRFWDADASSQMTRTIKKHVQKVYEVRSAIVHGVVVGADELADARRTLDRFVREVLLDYVAGVLDDFDPKKLWIPPEIKTCEGQKRLPHS